MRITGEGDVGISAGKAKSMRFKMGDAVWMRWADGVQRWVPSMLHGCPK